MRASLSQRAEKRHIFPPAFRFRRRDGFGYESVAEAVPATELEAASLQSPGRAETPAAMVSIAEALEYPSDMAHHHLAPSASSIHGHYSPSLPACLEIDPGDTVTFRTLDIGFGEVPPVKGGMPRATFPYPPAASSGGPALHGPVLVRGARAGGCIEIRIDEALTAPFGWCCSGGRQHELDRRTLTSECERELVHWSLADGLARSSCGPAVPIRPFPGMLGVCPAGEGPHDAWLPTIYGGNMDCRELVAGSTLYLPIGIDGALLSVGDGHAAQGDGEVCGMGIECPFERLTLTISLRDDMRVSGPLIRASDGWVTLGFGPVLEEASFQALNGMLDLVCARFGVKRAEALALASAAVDMRITQIANGTLGVHAYLGDDRLVIPSSDSVAGTASATKR